MTGESATTHSWLRRASLNAGVLLLSALFACAGVLALSLLADALRWCCVSTLALQEGAWLADLLLAGLPSFHLVRWMVRHYVPDYSPGFGASAHVCYVAGALACFFPVPSVFLALPIPWWFAFFKWIGITFGVITMVPRALGRAVPQFGLGVVGLAANILIWVAWWNFKGYLA